MNQYASHEHHDFLGASAQALGDPSLQAAALAAEWVDGADVLYIAKAGPGSKGNRGLRRSWSGFRPP